MSDEPEVREYEFRGATGRVYPSHRHPEQPGALTADPGEIIDFGNQLPPDDGLWYDVRSGEQVLPLSPSVEGADSAQEDADKEPES